MSPKNILYYIFRIGMGIATIFAFLGFVYLIMYSKTIDNITNKAEDYCKYYDGVKSIEEESYGDIIILCNQVSRTRSFLLWNWQTYEGTTIPKDGKKLQDKANLIIYFIIPLVICYFGTILTKPSEYNQSSENKLKENEEKKDE